MDELFGVPMDSIMLALLALLTLALITLGYVIARSRIMFLMGLRNVPRRPAQTALIIVGLMLSTLIISAAFTTGDTVDYSLTNQSYTLLGHVDEVIQPAGEEGAPNERTVTIPQDVNDDMKAGVLAAADTNIDGYLPVLFERVPLVNPDSRQSEPSVTLAGLDADSLDGFPDVISATSGELLDVSSLAPDEAFINESAADELDTEPGDRVQVFVQSQPFEFTVADVVEDRFTTGVGDFDAKQGLVTRLDAAQEIFGKQGEVTAIAISNAGGVRDSIGLTDEVVTTIETQIANKGDIDLEVEDVKRELVDSAEEAGNFMATFFLVFGLFSIAAGILLIVMIFVMLAAERKSEMGMARAVGTKRNHLVQMFMSEGMAYNLLSAIVGAGLGVLVAFGIAEIMARIFSEFGLSIEPHVTLRSLVISYSLGVVLTFLTVTFSSWRVSKLNIVRAIRDIPEPPVGRMGWRWLAAGLLSVGIGALLFVNGMRIDSAFSFALGFSLVIGGLAVLLRYLRLRERPVFTAMGGLLLVLWGLTAGNRLESLFGPLEGDIEMFFLSGIAMVTASTFILIYNADVVLAVVSRLGGIFGAVLPAMKTAVAYPLAYKFRTGMTLAMVSLVVFALTMMSAMNANFSRLFLTDSARGGWDVVALENPNNPIADLNAALRAGDSSTPDGFRAVGRLGLPAESEVREIRAEPHFFSDYPVWGVDDGFLDGGDIPLAARARDFDSDRAVWQALKTEDDVAIVDGFTTEGGGLFADESFDISRIDTSAGEFDPIPIEMRDPINGGGARVRVIGVIDFAASATFFGVYIPERTFGAVFGEPEVSQHYVALRDSDASKEVAREIEATLLTAGVEAESIKERVDDDQALSRNFFRLMQGFMGLGLLVGIAAVGVIAFRTVVERRQQIGMLRAIGYKRSTVALSFFLESSFIMLMSIISGVGLAIWLSYFLITSDEFPSDLGGYFIPWDEVLFISLFTYAGSLVMTLIPSRQAAGVPIAEALRYE